MSSERFWVLVLALTVFCAGLATGLLLSFRSHPLQDTGRFGAYEARMTETFGLDEEQVRNLRWILQDYQEQIDGLKNENLAKLEPKLENIGRQHRDLIRTWVVPEHHRQEFDLWAGGLPALPTGAEPQ